MAKRKKGMRQPKETDMDMNYPFSVSGRLTEDDYKEFYNLCYAESGSGSISGTVRRLVRNYIRRERRKARKSSVES